MTAIVPLPNVYEGPVSLFPHAPNTIVISIGTWHGSWLALPATLRLGAGSCGPRSDARTRTRRHKLTKSILDYVY